MLVVVCECVWRRVMLLVGVHRLELRRQAGESAGDVPAGEWHASDAPPGPSCPRPRQSSPRAHPGCLAAVLAWRGAARSCARPSRVGSMRRCSTSRAPGSGAAGEASTSQANTSSVRVSAVRKPLSVSASVRGAAVGVRAHLVGRRRRRAAPLEQIQVRSGSCWVLPVVDLHRARVDVGA